MQPQPSPNMSGAMIQQGQSINKKTLEQLQHIQKEQQAQREKEQADAVAQQQQQVEQQQQQALVQARDRAIQQKQSMLIEEHARNQQSTLSSGFGQSLYGDFGSQSNSLLSGPYNANNLGSAGAIQQAALNPMQAYLNNLKSPAQQTGGAPNIHSQHIQMITNHHVAMIPTLGDGMS
jgi:hypothetical protein